MVARRVQIWSTPNDPDGFRLLAEPPVLSVSTMDRAADEGPGSGSITIPADWEYLPLALEIDPSDVAGSAASGLIVISQLLPNPASGSGEPENVWTPVFEFFADAASEKLTDEGPVVIVSGPEIRSGLDDGVVHPKSSNEPHYQWGAPTITRNADLLESAVANEEISVWIVPDGASDPSGTWQILINGQNSGNLDWDATPSEIKTAIDAAVTTITEALVSGSGTADDPWKIILVDDPPANQTIVTNSSIVDGALFSSIDVEGGNATPAYWTKAQTAEGVVFGTHGGASMNVVDDPAGGSGKALLISGNSAFIGAQQIIDVEVGSTGYASVELYTTSSVDEFRLVLRTLDGGFVASTGGSGGYEGVTVTPSTWNTLSITGINLLEEYGDRLILRIAVVSEGNPTDFYLRNLEYHPGLPGTTAGDISQILATSAAGRGALDWIDFDTRYSDTLDAGGNAWDESALAFQADAGEALGTHVHGDLQTMGYELDLVRIPDDELASGSGVIPTHYLELYNPGGRGPAANLNSAIVIGAGVGGGTVEKRRVPFTHLLVETYDGGYVQEVTDARLAGLPRREAFVRAEQARDAATATKIGEAVLEAMIENLFATEVQLVGDTVVAYRDFDIGSTIPYTLGASRAGRHNRRVSSISMRFDGDKWTDTITASKLYPGATTPGGGGGGADSPLVLEALRKLYARFERIRRPTRESAVRCCPPPDYSIYLPTPGVPSLGPDIVEWTGNGPDPTIPLPSNMTPGDLMFLVCQIDSGTGVALDSVPAGWVDHGQIAADNSSGGGAGIVLAKDVTAGDISAGSVTLNMSSSEELAVVIWYVSGSSDTASTVAIASENPSLTAEPSPETVPVTVTEADEYWIFPIWYANKGSFPTDQQTDGPSGYDAFAVADVGGGVLAPAVHVWDAYKSLTTSEDPGAFSWSSSVGSRIYAHATIAVRDEPDTGSQEGLAAADHTHEIADITDLVEGLSIADLSDVSIASGEPTDGDVLIWNDSAGAWEPGAAGASSIADLADVDIASGEPSDGDLLVWNDSAGAWEPVAVTTGPSADDAYIWRPLLDDDGAIVVDDSAVAVMGFGPA